MNLFDFIHNPKKELGIYKDLLAKIIILKIFEPDREKIKNLKFKNNALKGEVENLKSEVKFLVEEVKNLNKVLDGYKGRVGTASDVSALNVKINKIKDILR